MRTSTLLIRLAALLIAATWDNSTRADDLQSKALAILSASCAPCHGAGNEKHGDLDYILDIPRLIDNELLDPQQPEQSRLLQRILDDVDPMPPRDAADDIPRPTPEQIDVLREWVASLRNSTPTPPPLLPQKQVQQAKIPQDRELVHSVREFLEKQPALSRSQWRFFTLAPQQRLSSSPDARNKSFQSVGIDVHRAALAKAVNSLVWSADGVDLTAIDEAQLILGFNLQNARNRDGQPWSESREWTSLLEAYPYGIDLEVEDFRAVQHMTASPIPIVRADWFVATALRPPLYHTLLGIPDTAAQLEQFLGVNVTENILKRRAARVGFISSGASKNANRLVERHPSRFGFYWKSYDFLPDSRRGNIIEFPTGPVFSDNPFPDTAFEHDGGEIIFSLPNGLQGYMLVDRDGNRIDVGPGELVSDDKKTSGSPLIVNGISCIACHKHGVYPLPEDDVFPQTPVAGDVRDLVRQLHDPVAVRRSVDRDTQRFLFALENTTAEWYIDSPSSPVSMVNRPEPITPLASYYVRSELGIAEVAAELDGIDVQQLKLRITNDPQSQRLGLKPLAEGGTIKRDDWQRINTGLSKFQQVVRQIGGGVPITVLSPAAP